MGSGGQRGASLSFTVASYNILSQALLEEHSYLYEHLEERYRTWNHRRQKLLHELVTYQPDVSTMCVYMAVFMSLCMYGCVYVCTYNSMCGCMGDLE